jgi:hypothetical protein
MGHLSFIHQLLYSSLLDLGRFFSFVILYTVGRTPWAGDQPVARPLPTHTTARTHIHALSGFEPTTPAFKQTKTVHALDPAATVIGCNNTVWTIQYYRSPGGPPRTTV